MHAPSRLVDRFGRTVTSLRIAVTDRCNLHCGYCMPSSVKFLSRDCLLTFEEIARFVRIVCSLGVRKVRLTGGEPTLRSDLPELIGLLARTDGVEDLAMTTNGLRLREMVSTLRQAGLQRVNVSLDTLDREKFARMTGHDGLTEVLAGIDEARRVGFSGIKINVVALRGFTEEEIPAFARLARRFQCEVRFIEFMPLSGDTAWTPERVLPGDEIFRRIHAEFPLEPVPEAGTGPAAIYQFRDGQPGTIGIIPSVSRPFCGCCNRIRLTPDGQLRTCLFAHQEIDMRRLLRGGATNLELAQTVVTAVGEKERGHRIHQEDFVRPSRPMSSIGG